MRPPEPMRVGYVVKRYPRYSETFIVNEILAHEAAGMELEIFSLLPPNDTHFQDLISRVRAPVTYVAPTTPKAAELWEAVGAVADSGTDFGASLRSARGEAVRDIYQALLLSAEVRRRCLGHLHAHFATSAATVARLASRIAGIGFTLTAHAKDIFHHSVAAADLVRAFADAAAIVTVSDHNVAHLQRVVAQEAAKVVRIYNGLDLARFPFAPPDDRPPVILGVGRLVEKKGFGDLVEACSVLAARGRAFQCQILGTGPLEAELREHVARLGLPGRVSLLGPRPQHEVVCRMQGASAFAAPCVVGADGNRDGLPTVLLEAMALGTPCVATPVTGIPEAVHDGVTGLLVPERHPAALADALERLLEDRELRLRLASRARRRIEDAFDIAQNAGRLRRLFGAGSPNANGVLEHR